MSTSFVERFFRRERSKLAVEIDLDPVPGWGNTPDDHRDLVLRLLRDAVPHYNPTVVIDTQEGAALIGAETLRQAWDEGHLAGGMWDHFQHTDPKFGPDANPYGAAVDDPDDEKFCPKCFAGLASGEHREKCGVQAKLGGGDDFGVYAEIAAERQRAHAKHGPTSMESYPVGSFIRYTILAEEVGEVAKEFNEAEARGGQHTLNLSRIRVECIQVAAMAAAWADRLRFVLEESE